MFRSVLEVVYHVREYALLDERLVHAPAQIVVLRRVHDEHGQVAVLGY